MVSEAKAEHSRTFPTTVVLALMAPAGYAFAYSFERGYADFFGIPPEYVAVSLEQMIIGIFGIALSSIGALFTLAAILSALPTKIAKGITKAGYSAALSVMIFLWLLFGFVTRFHGNTFYVATFFFGWYLIGLLVLTFVELRWGSASNEPRSAPTPSDRINVALMAVAATVFVVTGFAYPLGQSIAANKVSFLTAIKNPKIIQLAVYGDTQILGIRSSKGHQLEKRFIIAKVGEGPFMDFSVSQIEPFSKSQIGW